MKIHSSISWMVIICLYLLTFLLIIQNLSFQYLWIDETVQFWISKGLNPDSEPFSAERGVFSVIGSNKYYNLDPGGFGILLHYWSIISNSPFWLRLLPFLFFTGIVLSFIYLSFKWSENLYTALLMGFIPIIYPMTLNMGFEIRAYSMEALGSVLCVIGAERLKNKISYKNLLLWACVFAFFITSRYSITVVVFVTSLYILYLIFRNNNPLKEKLLQTLLYASPVLLSLAFICFFAFIYQNANLQPLFYLKYLNTNPEMLMTPKALLYLSFILFVILLTFLRNKYPVIKKYNTLLLIALIVNIIFIILSFIGKHPWIPPFHYHSNRCISMIILMMLCFAGLATEFLKYLFNRNPVASKYIVLILLIIVLVFRRESLLLRYDRNVPKRPVETESLNYIANNLYYDFKTVSIKSYNKIFVDYWYSSYVRYLFEYRMAKDEKADIYPGKFTFAKMGRHGFQNGVNYMNLWGSKTYNPDIDSITNYDMIILSGKADTNTWVRVGKTTHFWIKRDVHKQSIPINCYLH